MSTNDVPGANPANSDRLAMGCWAEHEDGSLILVESTEGNRVVYSVFDMSKKPPIEYRDAMPEVSFKRTFTWKPGSTKIDGEKWTWHDKSPFPFDKVIREGFGDGPRHAAAEDLRTAAERVMDSRRRLQQEGATAAERVADTLQMQGRELDRSNFDHRFDRVLRSAEDVLTRIAAAFDRAGKKKDKGARR